MARADAAPLIALSHQISHEGPCAQARDIVKLQHEAVALVNAHRVPSALAESLMSGVNAIVTPVCLPPVTTSTPEPAEPAPHEKKDHHDKHGKHKEKGD